jgi:hypothetical protein
LDSRCKPFRHEEEPNAAQHPLWPATELVVLRRDEAQRAAASSTPARIILVGLDE